MKKRLLWIILALALLCGCGSPAVPDTTDAPPAQVQTEAPTLAPTEAPLPGEPLVVYPMDSCAISSLVPMGDDILLFSTNESTVLTRFDGRTMEPVATTQLKWNIYPDEVGVTVTEDGVTYIDIDTNELVFLDNRLQECKRFPIPADAVESPELSEDRRSLYYMSVTGLRVLDLESGIDRLIREMGYSFQSISNLYCGDTVIQCGITDSHGTWRYLYIDVRDGQIVHESAEYLYLSTTSDRYFTIVSDGHFEERLTGTPDGQVRALNYYVPNSSCYPVLNQDAVIVVSAPGAGQVTMDYFRLTDGMRPGSIVLPDGFYPWTVAATPDGSIWFASFDSIRGCDVIARWIPELTPVEDDTVYIGVRRTADNPDTQGLKKCAELAAEISERHHVKILTWLDAANVEPWDYTFEAEYQVPLIMDSLAMVDRVLSSFPEGVIEKATADMGDGFLRIGLVRGLYGVSDSGALDSATGVHYWDDRNNSCISMQAGYALEQNLYHELYHALESRIYSHSQYLDNWDDLNPRGFSYDYGYRSYWDRDEYHLLEGDSRAFIDFYSMTYPKEDRARILEYAATPGNEFYFTSGTMQQKLRTLCLAIREAYDLEAETEAFVWEQYLDDPIHANG